MNTRILLAIFWLLAAVGAPLSQPMVPGGFGPMQPGGSSNSAAPGLVVTVPSAGATLTGSVALTATAVDVVFGIKNVQFQVDGANIGSAITSAPYTFPNWNSAQVLDGAHTLTALATASTGNSTAISAGIAITTSNGTVNSSYEFATAGDDSANCKAPTPCATTAKANSLTYFGGDNVQFNGGDAFSGCINISRTHVVGGSPAHILNIQSYGTGQATINGNCPGATTATVMVDGINANVNNLIIRGTSVAATSPHACVWVQNSSGPTTIDTIFVQNNDIGGCTATSGGTFGGNIFVTGFPNVAAIPVRHLSIINNTIHGLSGPSSIDQNGITGFGNGKNISIVDIRGNSVFNHGAASGGTPGTLGNGILPGGTLAAHVHFNSVHNNGGNTNACGGPAGVFSAQTDGFTAESNEVYLMGPITNTGGCDWDGADCDVSSTNCTLQYMYVHNDFGPGYLLFDNGATWGPGTLRYSITENDGFLVNDGSAGVISTVGPVNVNIYNMTAYTDPGGVSGRAPSIFSIASFGSPPTAGGIFNSIFAAGKTLFNQAQFVHIPALGSSPFVMKNNDYWATNGGTFLVQQASTVYNSLAAWQAVAPGGETGAITSDPTFAGTPTGTPCVWTPNTDSGPQSAGCPPWAVLSGGSPARGTGLDITMAPFNIPVGPNDYYGTAIPNGSGTGFNIGAYGG